MTTSIIGKSKSSDSRKAQSVVNAVRQHLGRDSEDSTTAFSSPDRLLQVSIPDPKLASRVPLLRWVNLEKLLSTGLPRERTVVQTWGSSNQIIGSRVFAAVVNVSGNIAAIQNKLRDWSNAKCIRSAVPQIDIDMIPSTRVLVQRRSSVST